MQLRRPTQQIKRGYRKLDLPASKIRSQARQDALCVSQGEVDPAFHGPGAATNQAGATSADQGADCGAESTLAGLGRVLQTCPGPKTLPTSRRLDPAANLVASVPTLAQRRLETAARDQVVRRVRACTIALLNTCSCILASLSLRESCMHETCTCSLRGGRRPARKRASSDPTIQRRRSRKSGQRCISTGRHSSTTGLRDNCLKPHLPVGRFSSRWRWSGSSRPSKAWPELLHDAADSG